MKSETTQAASRCTEQRVVGNFRKGQEVTFRGRDYLWGGVVNAVGYAFLGNGCLTSGLIVDPADVSKIEARISEDDLFYTNKALCKTGGLRQHELA